MDKYDYCKDIKDRYNIEELDSLTLSYRINGFLDACNMDIEKGMYFKLISGFRRSFINKSHNIDGLSYSINFTRGYNKEDGNSLLLVGKYNDLEIFFENFIDGDYKINEIPFSMSLSKKYSGYEYKIEIHKDDSYNIQFRLYKKKDNESLSNYIGFYAKITDFSKILNLVNSFVNNPKTVFDVFYKIMNEKTIIFTNDDLNKVIKGDNFFDKSSKNIRKKLKILTNND